MDLLQERHFLTAGRAPSGPEIEEDRTALGRIETRCLPCQAGEGKRRGWLADRHRSSGAGFRREMRRRAKAE